MKNEELRIENSIYKWLESFNIFPFSVFFTFCTREGLLSITFFLSQDLSEFLDKIGYKKLVDKSGINVIEDTNTVLLSGTALTKFYTLL